jgi:hypothetical protein
VKRSILSLLVILAAATPAAAVPETVAFTGRLVTAAGPVEGGVTVEFALFPTAAGGTATWQETHALVAEQGLVYAALGSVDPSGNPLDAQVLDGGALFLEITVDGTALSPRTAVRSVPYAIRAGVAEVATVATSIDGLGAGDLQQVLDASCPAGSSIRAIDPIGAVTCETDDDSGGDITAVAAGAGLTGGGAAGAVALAVDTAVIQARVNQACAAGQAIRLIATDGSVLCEPDDDSGGDVTAVTAGTGLTGGGATGAIGLAIDDAIVARKDSSAGTQTFDGGTLTLDYGTNRVGIGTTLPLDPLEVAGRISATSYRIAPGMVSALVLGAADFTSSIGADYFQTASGYIYANQIGLGMVAPVHLPDGATITELRCYYYDNHAAPVAFTFDLYRRGLFDTAGTSIANAAVTTTTNTTTVRSAVTTAITTPAVDNTSYAYYVRIQLDATPTFVDNNVRLYGCRVLYQWSDIRL